MNTVGCESIQVWSVWHAESFYKGLGFRNVMDYPVNEDGVKVRDMRPNRIEGDHGPLLFWNYEKRLRSSASINLDNFSIHEGNSIRNSISAATLKSKDSLLSLQGYGTLAGQKEYSTSNDRKQ